jgi:hypothetical protein
VLSGAYASAEIMAEFGRLPPSFLPIGGKRLFHHQIELAQSLSRKFVITIPDDFELDRWDEQALDDAGARVIRSPLSLSLIQAVQFVLEVLQVEGDIALLHGDTLVEGDTLTSLDCVFTQETNEYYAWADVAKGAKRKELRNSLGDGFSPREVACGFFTFSDAGRLRRAVRGQSDFIDGINRYGELRALSFKRVQQWYDFGHLPLIFQSKQKMLVGRAFNHLTGHGNTVEKSSHQTVKMDAEANWYRAIPEEMRVFTPQFLGQSSTKEPAGYCLEYLYHPTVAELFVYGRLPSYVWRKILAGCCEFLEQCRNYRPAQNSEAASERFAKRFFMELIKDKPSRRLDAFLQSRQWSDQKVFTLNGKPTPPVGAIMEDFQNLISPTTQDHICLWHGDFFFGNTFYDFRAGQVRVVDPRGGLENGPSIYGDWRYDVAKLAHSIYGRYDVLLSGRAEFEIPKPDHFNFLLPSTEQSNRIERDFGQLTIGGETVLSVEIKAMVGLLFLSMLDLHKEDMRRQSLFLANALRIHRELCGDLK